MLTADLNAFEDSQNRERTFLL